MNEKVALVENIYIRKNVLKARRFGYELAFFRGSDKELVNSTFS